MSSLKHLTANFSSCPPDDGSASSARDDAGCTASSGQLTVSTAPSAPDLRGRHWWARASLVLIVGSAVLLLAFAGRHSVTVILIGAAALAVTVAAGFWFLRERGLLRWISLALAVAAPVAMVVVFIAASLLWVVVVAAALVAAAVWAARAALRPDP